MSEWQVHTGDWREVLPRLEAEGLRVDAVVMDPPYGLGFDYGGYEDTRENLAEMVSEIMPVIRRLAKRVVVMPGITQVHLYPTPDWIGCVTWDTTGSFGAYGFTQWMPVLLYGGDVPGFARLGNGMLKSDVLRLTGGAGVGFMREGKTGHPCPKPVNVMRDIVLRYTEDGDTVLDPFAGSATTGVACLRNGRRFVGVELNADFADEGRKRLAREAAQPMLIGAGA